jgi:hypothetical protein
VGPWLRELQGHARVSFGLRHQLIGWDARLKRGLGLSESYGSEVTQGREGWLFYRVHRGTHGVRPEVPFPVEELDRWVENLDADRRLVESRGGAFLFLAAPDKQTILPDLLPPELPAAATVSRLDALTARLRARGIAVVDLRPVLRAAREPGAAFSRWPLYFRTDDHWNDLGALLAGREVLRALQARFPGVQVPADREIDVWTVPTAGGDLARMEGLQEVATDVWVKARVRSGRCLFEAFDPVARSPETPTRQAQTLHCPGAPIRRALVQHDSMMVAMLPVLAPAFERSVWRLSPSIDPGLLASESPEVVILEVVERTLWEGLPGW